MKKIVIFCPYPLEEAPSQRFRFEQYFHLLKKNGFKITVLPFYNQRMWKQLYQKQKSWSYGLSILVLLLVRGIRSFQAINADYVFIHREMTPVGPPLLEFVLAKIFRRKIIYDFDDTIWLTDKTNESWVTQTIRWRGKVSSICKWSHRVSVGNAYLAQYARQFNQNVLINPTTIDTEKVHNSILHDKESATNRIVIGWTGSHSTLKYLNELEPVLKSLEAKYPDLEFWVIADTTPPIALKSLRFKPWSRETEISDLAQFDIGIMPLPDDDWTRGKCGFKALQYMALEIPTVASPVGVNISIIKNGINGYLASNANDWEKLLSLLIEDRKLRVQLGLEGRKTVELAYSVASNERLFLKLFGYD